VTGRSRRGKLRVARAKPLDETLAAIRRRVAFFVSNAARLSVKSRLRSIATDRSFNQPLDMAKGNNSHKKEVKKPKKEKPKTPPVRRGS
jgi:hypothetical protein